MNEVSTKVFEILLPRLRKKGVSVAEIVRGTTVTPAHLQDRKNRVDWADYVTIMRNVRRSFSDDELIALGRTYMRAPGLRFAFVVARLLLSPMDLYRWFSKPKQGVGNQMFTCIKANHREVSPSEIELELVVPEEFEVCWEFYLISIGNFEEIPRLFGLRRASVELQAIARGGRFRIVIPQRDTLRARAWRFMSRPFVGRAAAKELQAAHEALVDRFAELESAQMKLDRQATQLRTAHTVNELVQRDIEVEKMLHTIATALVDEAGFDWAEIRLGEAEATPPRMASHGSEVHEPPLLRTLEARGGERVGDLAAAPKPGADRAEREALLDFITPALGIALQNALFRMSLEQLVDRRTAELRTARDQLTGTVQKLEEARGARERFFANVSHEFRTPLTIILLAIGDVARRAGAALDPRAQVSLESVNQSARKLLRLVDELLLLAAGQEEKLEIRPEPTDLSSLIEGVVEAWKPTADAAGLELTSEVAAGVAAKVDAVALERVTTNLLSNAVKYTPRGGRVLVQLADEQDALRLSVLDTGVGISEDLAGRLFGRFERGANVHRTTAGTGIGLSLVKQLVEAHEGMVRAISRESGGTEMRVLLPASRRIEVGLASAPMLQLSDHVELAPVTTAPPRSVPDGIAQGTVLIAEDDVVLADMIAEVLADEYTVRVANDGEAALALAIKDPPHMLITDIDMPKLDGIELARRFREATKDKLAPIVILSALHSLGTRVSGLDAGAVDYVTKPFDPTELKARVRAQFRMRDLAVRLHRAEQLSTLGILTSGLAHELRNPANGVVNAIGPLREMLPKEMVDSGGVGTLLEVIEECARQLDTLSRQLLGFRDPGTRLDTRPIEASKLVASALSICVVALNGVDVRVKIPTDVTVVVAPPMMLQVLTNLIENAAQAAGKGGWVSIDVHVSDNTTSFEIGDSGPGVPPEMRRSIFEPFFTTKPPGVGTGLGLPLARDIVARHRGSLELRERGGRHV
ncbi:MAG: ATP-binding protein, partial [Kofleriaceae bacterium]|nr:ATP-binding protein [Kofleriaceae bacterium]